ncbi:MAG: sigma 54-interacting transcriptional regulator, partial [Pseudomonadales bacterium]
ADLPISMQVKLLRAIQEKAVRAVGASTEVAIDVRILSATHKDLANEVKEGAFRQDLFYRLNVIELSMPSLRERPDDIPELAEQILQKLCNEYEASIPQISDEAMLTLQRHEFPGNVRELENVLERAFTLCEDARIQSSDLQLGGSALAVTPHDGLEAPEAGDVEPTPVTGIELAPGQSLEDYLEDIERLLITDALDATRWNKTAAAKRLGITFRALRYRLKKLQLE